MQTGRQREILQISSMKCQYEANFEKPEKKNMETDTTIRV